MNTASFVHKGLEGSVSFKPVEALRLFFGVGLKLTRANAPLELREFEMPMEDQLRTLRRLHTGTIVNLLLTIYAYTLGVTMV